MGPSEKDVMVYQRYIKRILDFFISLIALIILSPLLLLLVILGAVKLGGNPFFTQLRPGKIDPRTGKERIFKLIKLRTMTNEKDASGNLLPDDVRLVPYGKWLRSTSLDELFELVNILKGDMAIIGPRPQLVRDMVFMTDEQRKRHLVRPGLSGLAQVRGRNAISWDGKLATDLEYISHISFPGDLKIVWMTIRSVLKREGVTMEGMETAMDFGDVLLMEGRVSKEEYDRKQEEARKLIEEYNRAKGR